MTSLRVRISSDLVPVVIPLPAHVVFSSSGGADSANPDAEPDDADAVELEKSNVLLMGPTGSGTTDSFSAKNVYAFVPTIRDGPCYILFLLFLHTQAPARILQLARLICHFALLVRTGKTLLAKTLARFVNVPFVIADATTLTQASLHLVTD